MDKNDHLAIGLYSCDRLLHALITAPIPHQSVVEIHKSALRYVREKLRKYYELRVLLEQIEIYRDMKIGQCPTIPNFIYVKLLRLLSVGAVRILLPSLSQKPAIFNISFHYFCCKITVRFWALFASNR